MNARKEVPIFDSSQDGVTFPEEAEFDEEEIRKAFLGVWMELLEGYTKFLLPTVSEDGAVFDNEKFIKSAPKSHRKFLQKIFETSLINSFLGEAQEALTIADKQGSVSERVKFFDESVAERADPKRYWKQPGAYLDKRALPRPVDKWTLPVDSDGLPESGSIE